MLHTASQLAAWQRLHIFLRRKTNLAVGKHLQLYQTSWYAEETKTSFTNHLKAAFKGLIVLLLLLLKEPRWQERLNLTDCYYNSCRGEPFSRLKGVVLRLERVGATSRQVELQQKKNTPKPRWIAASRRLFSRSLWRRRDRPGRWTQNWTLKVSNTKDGFYL